MTIKEKYTRLIEKGALNDPLNSGDIMQTGLLLKALTRLAPCILPHPIYSDDNVIAFVEYMWKKYGDVE